MRLLASTLVLSTLVLLLTGCAARSQYSKQTSVPIPSPERLHSGTSSSIQRKAMSPDPLIQLTRSGELEEIIGSAPGVVLIDFYADWCGPCRTQSGVMDEMKDVALQQQASIVKVNIDQHPKLASAFEVTGLPTLMLMKNGQVLDRRQGLANHEVVAELLRQ